ncbi:Fatty acid synthase [Eumeta japonica]|uniref:oleoyl-[acyl-carrier-protein] hydrolase n=1 Tax=Eumeta variegata TaxID=151549 RepID=A0A4C1XN24_EUMVA|nr:Fatty acid synthase [Eumeta japonica]
MLGAGIAAGLVRPLSRAALGAREAPRALRLLAADHRCGRVLLSPEVGAAQIKILFSSSASYAVVCGDHEFGLELVDRLISRGAKNVIVYYDQKNGSGYLNIKLNLWKKTDANIKIFKGSLHTYDNATEYLRESAKLGRVEGIFIVDESNEVKAKASVVENLDVASMELCPSLKYFVALRTTADKVEPESQRICVRRRLRSLPALYFNIPTLTKFEQPKGINQSISSALDALETSMRLNYQEVTAIALKEEPKFDLLKEIEKILDVNIKELPDTTTLKSLNLDFEMTEEIIRVLERRYKYSFNRRNLLDITVGRFKEGEIKLDVSTKKKKTNLEVYFRNVHPDELTSSADLLVMQTLVYEPQIRSDEFEANETYLILVPGMEGHHGVFNTLCERLKIFALCMQPGLDHPRETPRETAQRLVKKLLQMVKLEGNFYLLGYSYGVLIAMEMAVLLEQRGLQGSIFCVDSAPDVFPVQLKVVLGDVSENELQNAVIDHMYSVMAGQSSDELHEQLANVYSWEEKADLACRHLRGLIHYSSQYARAHMETAYGRIVEAAKYLPEHHQIRSKIVLIRSRHQPEAVAAYPKDFGLSKYTIQPVDVYDLEAEHADVLEDLRCTAIVHKHLESRLLEEYFKKNLCETYLPNGMKFLDITTQAIN